jgi:hypothetical protein
MTVEKLTDVLDLVAGMSAMPELVGQQRLNTTQEAFGRIAASFTTRKIARSAMDSYGDDSTRFSKVVTAVGVAVSIALLFTPVYARVLGLVVDPSVWLRLVLSPVAFVLGYWAYLLVGTILVHLIEAVVDLPLAAALWISRRAVLSRLLLFAGFAIFFASGVIKVLFK